MATALDNIELQECLSDELNKKDIKKKPTQIRQYIATIIVDVLHFTFGLAVGWSSTALPLLQSPDTPLTGGPITIEDGSWLVAILYLTASISMPVYGKLCEKFGRKACGYIIGTTYVISAVLLIAANSIEMIQASKAFLGLSSGGIFIVCPIYVSEIAEDNIRGTLGVVLTLMRNGGILVANIIGSYLPFRYVAWVSLIPPLVFLACFMRLPETPVYLLRRGKPEDAARSLRWFRSKDTDIEHEIKKLQAGLRAMSSERSAPASFKDLFSTKGSIKGVMIGLMLCFNQQLCGFFGIISYTVMIFQESGSTWSPNISSIIVAAMLVGGTILSAILCDRAGRKILFLFSDVFMVVSLSALGAYFYFKNHGEDMSKFDWLPVTCLSVYVISYNVGLASLPVVIMTEIFSPKLRNMALSANGCLTWFVMFLVSKFFPMFSKATGMDGSCWTFSACCFIGAVFIMSFVPETKNRTLESIVLQLEGKDRIPPRHDENEECFFISNSKPICETNTNKIASVT